MTSLLPMTRDPVIRYREEFWLPAAPAQVWAAIQQFDEYPVWWTWLHSFSAAQPGLLEGNVLRGTVQPPLPYRFHVLVRIVTCAPESGIAARVEGDVRGDAQLTLEPSGAGTSATVDWTLAMARGPIRFAAIIAYPAVRWAHDRVVESTVAAFCRRALGARSEEDSSRTR